jgi:hypothetical protein
MLLVHIASQLQISLQGVRGFGILLYLADMWEYDGLELCMYKTPEELCCWSSQKWKSF